MSDTRAPELLKAETSTDGLSIVLTYDEALDSAHMAAFDNYSLTVTDNGSPVTVRVNDASASDRTVTLNLSKAIESQYVVKLGYSDPSGNTTATVQDTAGNDSASLIDERVTIKVPDSTPPSASRFKMMAAHQTAA